MENLSIKNYAQTTSSVDEIFSFLFLFSFYILFKIKMFMWKLDAIWIINCFSMYTVYIESNYILPEQQKHAAI
jgi:hypothetical protein